MGIAKINIWLSAAGDPCGTFAEGSEHGGIHIFDCKGILEWPCGRYLSPDGKWLPVPGGIYRHLPFKCGHLEVEVPPGCYWVFAGYHSKGDRYYHLNYTTHVGIVEVGCGETACVKLFNPTVRLCWNWFWLGLKMLSRRASKPVLDPEKVKKLVDLTEELLRPLPVSQLEAHVKETLDGVLGSLEKGKGKKRT